MSDKDLFVETPPTTPEQVLPVLVGEGKTYKTVEDLAKGKLNADIHIKRVEQENKELREKLAGAKTVDDVLAAVQAKVASEGDPSENKPDEHESSAPAPGLSAEQIAKIVSEQITGHETARQKTQNKDRANRVMFEMYGEKAGEVFAKEASTPELRDALIKLAEVGPDKFISMFKKDAQVSPGVDSSGSKSIGVINQAETGEAPRGTQKFYSNLRKKNPELYYSAAVQLEMHERALTDPDKYFGRNI